MFVEAQRISDGDCIDTDICIIGGGAAGITIARELSETPLRVCLLESGGFRLERDTQDLYDGEIAGLPYELETTRSRFFGGSTNCWAGFSRPLEDFHFGHREWISDCGWPISRADLDPYYIRAHPVCGISSDGYDPKIRLPALKGHDLRELPVDNARMLTLLCQLSRNRRRFGKVYRSELRRASNVSVYLHANAVELEQDQDGNRIDAVRVATLSGNRFRMRARFFVLATGGVENARLLLASNAREPAGIGNRYDVVGRYFMETPRFKAASVQLSAAAERAMKTYLPRYVMLRLPVGAEISVKFRVQEAERLLDAAAYFELVLRGEESESTIAFKSIFWELWRGALPAHPKQELMALFSSPLDVATFGLGVLTSSKHLVQSRRLQLISEQCPNPDSRVLLSHERDELGVNRVRLDWRLAELDRHSARRTTAILCEDLARAGLITLTEEMPRDSDEAPTPYWNWHHLGTTRMHDDPKRGVVDRTCRVHGLCNLFIAGSSVFTTGGHHHPTLTIVALAIRLADHLQVLMTERTPIQSTPSTTPAHTHHAAPGAASGSCG